MPAAEPAAEEHAAAAGAEHLEGLSVEIRHGDPRRFKPQTQNARFMTAQQMEQLVANIRRDRVLTSLPLMYEDPDLKAAGEPVEEILSGHHRVEAAIAAPLASIAYLCITSKLTDAQKVAIQLSHNAIVGQDDPATLAAMYAGLDLDARMYSGLDDTVLKAMEDVALTGLNVGIKYQEMHLFFLPEDEAVVAEALKDIEKAARKNQAYVARFADFDDFFETAVRVKSKFEAFNTGVAVRLLVDLAKQRLAQLEQRLAQLEAEAAEAPAPEESTGG